MLDRIGVRIRQACGVRLVGDLYERACDAGLGLPLDGKRRQRLRQVQQARTLFIHVPKNAGMSISAAMYGQQIKHATIRYYRRAAPRLLRRTTSFAVLRDPIERFISAFHYAQAGGSADNRVAAPFRDTYMAFRTIDDALDHLEAAPSVYAIDHIFRPQSWYISDRAGKVVVDRLFLMHEMDRVREFLQLRCGAELDHINASTPLRMPLDATQIARIERLYADDVALVAKVRATSRSSAGTPERTNERTRAAA